MCPADAGYVHVIANASYNTVCMRKHMVLYGTVSLCTASGLKDLVQAVSRLHLLGSPG